jgi:mercuric ion transport protein
METWSSGVGRAVSATVLAIGGLAATLAAAACCALPVALATLGIAGGTWMLDVAVIAGPWQRVLLWGGAAALAVALFVARTRSAPGCADDVCSKAGFRLPLIAIVMLGGGLAGLTLAAG